MVITKIARKNPGRRLRGGLESGGFELAGPSEAEKRQQELKAMLAAVAATCCSGRWADDVQKGVTDWPIKGMKLSRRRVLSATGDMTSNNRGERGTRRWTPPIAVSVEDMLDGMSIQRADWYYHPHAIRYDHRTRSEFDQWNPTYTIHEPGDETVLRAVWIKPPAYRTQRVRLHRRAIAWGVWEQFTENVIVEMQS